MKFYTITIGGSIYMNWGQLYCVSLDRFRSVTESKLPRRNKIIVDSFSFNVMVRLHKEITVYHWILILMPYLHIEYWKKKELQLPSRNKNLTYHFHCYFLFYSVSLRSTHNQMINIRNSLLPLFSKNYIKSHLNTSITLKGNLQSQFICVPKSSSYASNLLFESLFLLWLKSKYWFPFAFAYKKISNVKYMRLETEVSWDKQTNKQNRKKWNVPSKQNMLTRIFK